MQDINKCKLKRESYYIGDAITYAQVKLFRKSQRPKIIIHEHVLFNRIGGQMEILDEIYGKEKPESLMSLQFDQNEMEKRNLGVIVDPIEPKFKRNWRQIEKPKPYPKFIFQNKVKAMESNEESSKITNANKNSVKFNVPQKQNVKTIGTQKNFHKDDKTNQPSFVPSLYKSFEYIAPSKQQSMNVSSITITKIKKTADVGCQTDPIFESLRNPYDKKTSQVEKTVENSRSNKTKEEIMKEIDELFDDSDIEVLSDEDDDDIVLL